MADEEPRRLEDPTGEQYVVVDERRRHTWFGLSTWQWAVLGAYFVSFILWLALGAYAIKTRRNTDKLNTSICAQVIYLQGTKARDPLAQKRIDNLVQTLRSLQHCPKRSGPRVPQPPG
jgi:hypothetical protein